jgi:cytoskeleton protein RodZ
MAIVTIAEPEPMAEAQDPESPATASGVGSRLRAARVAAGLSLADISARTRIAERYLAAIEEGRFGDLASKTYVVGFARAHARTVGLDEKEIAAAIRGELAANDEPAPVPSVTLEPGDPARVPAPRVAWLAGLAALAVIVAGFVLWDSHYSPQVSLPELLPEKVQSASAPKVVSGPKPPAPAPARPAGPVVFTALDADIWVKFYDASGKQLMQKQMALGESYTVPTEADGPQLWTARPDALRITVGGREMPRIAEKPIKVKDVPVSAAALLARSAPAGATPAGATRVPPPPPPASPAAIPAASAG